MPVFSYVAIPGTGGKVKLLEELNALDHCQAYAADNQELLILVTDSPDKETEEKLQINLKQLHALESLHMTFGCNDESNYPDQ